MAIRYQTWAPGQQSARVRAVTEQDLRIALAAESATAATLDLRTPARLLTTRSRIGSTTEAPDITMASWISVSDQWLNRLNTAISEADASATDRIQAVESNAVGARRNAVIALIIVLAGTFAVAAAVSIRLARHLRRFGELVEAIASGDPGDVERLDDHQSDEIGELAQSLNRMTTSLADCVNARISVLEAVVGGRDLRETLELTAVLLGTDRDGSARHQFRLEPPTVGAEPLPDTTDVDLWLVDRSSGQPCEPPTTTEAKLGIRLAVMACNRTSEEADLVHQASVDHLTGLLNRRSIVDRLDDCLESREPCVVLYVDLDEFKPINDEYGHAVGDNVLKLQANRLDNFADRHRGVAGRVGGDEFLAILHTDDAEAAIEMVNRYLLPALGTCMTRPDAPDIPVSASIGLYVPTAGDSVESTIHAADQALFEAKASGRRQAKVAGHVGGTGSSTIERRTDRILSSTTAEVQQ